ncbi:MAG: RrF2 family transcriptional regulator [Lachnospiraceae bacterium]|nr:RrF2 family transcriptional regulator [Lachnospiraceae bacterium]
MMISTKGRYALRVMLDLAEHNTGEYIVLMDIANRQEISEKYLEGILSTLSKAGFVFALRGRGGGYKLAKAPELYTVGSIIKLTEGSLAPVACLDKDAPACRRAAECRTLPLWAKLNKLIDDFLEGTTLADLLEEDPSVNNYVI